MTMLLGGSPGELAKPLYDAAQAAWGDSDTWQAYVEISDLKENAIDMRGGLGRRSAELARDRTGSGRLPRQGLGPWARSGTWTPPSARP